jgi:hypothetical protein
MKKENTKQPLNHRSTTAQPSPTTSPILSLEAILAMKNPERISLYRRCDEEMRGRFLIQGKVLNALGQDGEDQLRKAGVPASSLSNARYAQLALCLADGKRKIHTGAKKPVPFTEEVYDSLTLEQCVLLAYGSTYRGTARVVQHRPSPETFESLLAMPDWPAELECFFANGTTRAGVKEQERLAAEAAAQLQQIQAAGATMQGTPAAPPVSAVPAAPVIVSAPPPAPVDQASPGDPANVVSFPGAPATSGLAATGDSLGDQAIVVGDEDEDDEVATSPEAIGVTTAEWMEHFEILEAMSRQLAPSVPPGDRVAMTSRLRSLAEELSRPVGDSSPALPETPAGKPEKPRKARRETVAA